MCFFNRENNLKIELGVVVSILVLMDVLLQFVYVIIELCFLIVSILVLMDVLLQCFALRIVGAYLEVSILVLMDVLLQ